MTTDPLAAPESAEEAMRLALLYVFQAKQMPRSALSVIEALKQDGYSVTLDATRPSGDEALDVERLARAGSVTGKAAIELLAATQGDKSLWDNREHVVRFISQYVRDHIVDDYLALATPSSAPDRHAGEVTAPIYHLADPSGDEDRDHDHHYDSRCETCKYLARPSGDEALRAAAIRVDQDFGAYGEMTTRYAPSEATAIYEYAKRVIADALATPSSAPDEINYESTDYKAGFRDGQLDVP